MSTPLKKYGEYIPPEYPGFQKEWIKKDDPNYHDSIAALYKKLKQTNTSYRINLLEKAKDNPEMQELINIECENNPLFWMNAFAYTYDPRKSPSNIPFVTYPFQDDYILELIDHVEKGQDMLTEKSRDMGVSWMILAVFVWGWRFKKWDCMAGSRGMDLVDKAGDMDSLFERMRFIIDNLPDWMLPKGFDPRRGKAHSKEAILINPEHNNSIVGQATGSNFGVGGRRKAVLYDEFAKWLTARGAWMKGADLTPCRLPVSTPEGKGNQFERIRHNKDLEITIKTLHWELHPFKDKEWYDNECKRRTPEEIAQELDISYEGSKEGRVYPLFGDQVRLGTGKDFDYRPELPMFCAWDFSEGGADPHAIIWWQKDMETDHIYIIEAYESSNSLEFMASLVNCFYHSAYEYGDPEKDIVERHKLWKTPVHHGDPYSADKKGSYNSSIRDQLEGYGINVNTKRDTVVSERIRLGTLMLKRMSVNERCGIFIDAMYNSTYPQRKEGSQGTQKNILPVHNQFSHMRTAFEYLADNEQDLNYRRAKPKNKVFKRRYHPLTGALLN